eukprot:gnl/Trimastix_PCT/143.p1 GENE.gnl/Trimastix_PCT/143~~gnl/Trimastix_PCT/143.p1  ORF type:complete len:470 (+),score=37.74 gnl/Trimastix_PCT/143:205-1410(+)
MNAQWSHRRAPRLHRNRNPMKYRRDRLGGAGSSLDQSLDLSWGVKVEKLIRLPDPHRCLKQRSKRTAQKLRDAAVLSQLQASDVATQEFITQAKEYIKEPPPRKKKERAKPDSVLVLDWDTNLLNRIPLKKIMVDAKDHIQPTHRDCLDNFVIAKRLTKTIGTKLCNHISEAKHLKEPTADQQCGCHLFPARFKDANGHVSTGDYGIARDKNLRELLRRGPMYRERVGTVRPALTVLTGIDAWIEKVSRQHEDRMQMSGPPVFTQWRNVVMKEVLKSLGLRSVKETMQDNPPPDVSLSNPQVQRELRFLRRHLVIAPCDKASQNLFFVCKNEYRKALWNELHSEAYKIVKTIPTEQLKEQLSGFRRRTSRVSGDSSLVVHGLSRLRRANTSRRCLLVSLRR